MAVKDDLGRWPDWSYMTKEEKVEFGQQMLALMWAGREHRIGRKTARCAFCGKRFRRRYRRKGVTVREKLLNHVRSCPKLRHHMTVKALRGM